jgi:hypothetical protein
MCPCDDSWHLVRFRVPHVCSSVRACFTALSGGGRPLHRPGSLFRERAGTRADRSTRRANTSTILGVQVALGLPIGFV